MFPLQFSRFLHSHVRPLLNLPSPSSVSAQSHVRRASDRRPQDAAVKFPRTCAAAVRRALAPRPAPYAHCLRTLLAWVASWCGGRRAQGCGRRARARQDPGGGFVGLGGFESDDARRTTSQISRQHNFVPQSVPREKIPHTKITGREA